MNGRVEVKTTLSLSHPDVVTLPPPPRPSPGRAKGAGLSPPVSLSPSRRMPGTETTSAVVAARREASCVC